MASPCLSQPFRHPTLVIGPATAGRRVSVEHLTGRQPVKGEKVPAVFGFDYIEKRKSENASDGA